MLAYMHSTQTDTWTSTYTWLYTSVTWHIKQHNLLLLQVQNWNQEWYWKACYFMKCNWTYKFHFSALGSRCRLNDQSTVLTDFSSLEEASLTQPMPSAQQPHQRLPRVGQYPGPSLPAPHSWETERSPAKQSSQREKDNSDWFCLITG